jgi:hypothetical protein
MLIGLSEDGDEKIIHTPRYCSVTEAVDLARQVYVTSLWVKNGNNADTPITVEFWCGIKATMPSNAELLALWLRDTHGLLI